MVIGSHMIIMLCEGICTRWNSIAGLQVIKQHWFRCGIIHYLHLGNYLGASGECSRKLIHRMILYMSHFPSTHLVTPFDSAKSQALSGQRLAKIRYKTTAKQAAKFPSVCASVPPLADSEIMDNLPALKVHIRAMLEAAQDGVIRSLYEVSDGKLSSVQDSDISVLACIGFLNAESEGGRLTKETIEAWFDSNLAEYVQALICEKLGYGSDGDNLTPEQEHTIGRHVKGYKDMYSALAGGKTIYQANQIASLRRVLGLVDSSEVGEKLEARLQGMLSKPKMEDLLEL